MLGNCQFIEYPEAFDPTFKQYDPSPAFRREFYLDATPEKATLAVCGLGLGYYYLNGRPISDNLLSTPVSDYNKTLWYHTYDITKQLRAGKNTLAVILGNGFYNEAMQTGWKTYTASWRDNPMFSLNLEMTFNGEVKNIKSDESWLCSENSPVIFNQLRSGEAYDARIGEDWKNLDFDTSDWVPARIAKRQPSGVLRKCLCQPIKIDTVLDAKRIFKNAKGNWVVDFGRNISGFEKVKIKGERGQEITIRHAERLFEDGTLNANGMDIDRFYKESPFQTDRMILSGNLDEYTPRFTYHGFRYIEVEGLQSEPTADNFKAVYIHQAIDRISDFYCSDETLNKLFQMSINSTYSNMFYCLTDCPTREKFGWLNDAQSSAEQVLEYFDSCLLFDKWMQDILDAQREDGELPGIVPTHGWGYEWGSGPVSSGVIFEVPYRILRILNNDTVLKKCYPAMVKHFKYILTKKNDKGLIGYGLADWAGPFLPSFEHIPTPLELSTSLLVIKIHHLMKYFAEYLGDSEILKLADASEAELTKAIFDNYVNQDGACKISEQTPISMMLVLGLYENSEPLKNQLLAEIEKHKCHHHCGMLGLQFLFNALTICGRPDLGMQILTIEGHPSYKDWILEGATTMYERWTGKESNNHHMLTGFLAWYKTVLVGLQLDREVNGYKKAVISPWFVEELNYCGGSYKTVSGEYKIHWQRNTDSTVTLSVTVPENATAELKLNGYQHNFEGNILTAGKYQIVCQKVNLK